MTVMMLRKYNSKAFYFFVSHSNNVLNALQHTLIINNWNVVLRQTLVYLKQTLFLRAIVIVFYSKYVPM